MGRRFCAETAILGVEPNLIFEFEFLTLQPAHTIARSQEPLLSFRDWLLGEVQYALAVHSD